MNEKAKELIELCKICRRCSGWIDRPYSPEMQKALEALALFKDEPCPKCGKRRWVYDCDNCEHAKNVEYCGNKPCVKKPCPDCQPEPAPKHSKCGACGDYISKDEPTYAVPIHTKCYWQNKPKPEPSGIRKEGTKSRPDSAKPKIKPAGQKPEPSGMRTCQKCGNETPAKWTWCIICHKQEQPEPRQDSHLFYICEFCGCNTNACLRRCCDKGTEADLAKKDEPEPSGLQRYAYNINHEMVKSTVGSFCKYKEAAARIAQLEEQLTKPKPELSEFVKELKRIAYAYEGHCLDGFYSDSLKDVKIETPMSKMLYRAAACIAQQDEEAKVIEIRIEGQQLEIAQLEREKAEQQKLIEDLIENVSKK